MFIEHRTLPTLDVYIMNGKYSECSIRKIIPNLGSDGKISRVEVMIGSLE